MQALGYPATWPTVCFLNPEQCRAQVFAHTNGFGDFVLFDRLGWPWKIHECYENRFMAGSTRSLSGLRTIQKTSEYISTQVSDVPPQRAVSPNNIRRIDAEALAGKGEMAIAGYVQDYVERRAERIAKDFGDFGKQLFMRVLGSARSQLTVVTTDLESYTFFADLSTVVVQKRDTILARVRSLPLMGIPGRKAVLLASEVLVIRSS